MRPNDVRTHAKSKDGDYLFPHMKHNQTLDRKLERITERQTTNTEKINEEPQVKPFDLGTGYER
mgnify:CR=1 FL=1